MGTDIHVVLERKVHDKWEYFDSGFDAYDLRCSEFFDFLRDISHGGCPEELENKKLRPYTTMYLNRDGSSHEEHHYDWDTTEDGYMFGYGYIALDELKKKAGRRDVVWVSESFLEIFECLGGVLPEGMVVDQDIGIKGSSAVAVHVIEDDDTGVQEYIFRGIQEMQEIADAHGLQDTEIRMCFAFDN